MSPIVSSPTTIAEWQGILDRIEESVATALAETNRRELDLVEPPGRGGPAFPDAESVGKLLAGLESRLASANQAAAEIEAMLAQDEKVVAAWCRSADAARERLNAAERL